VTTTQRSQSHFVLLGRCWRSWYGDENASFVKAIEKKRIPKI
jgi:hypothetical protein